VALVKSFYPVPAPDVVKTQKHPGAKSGPATLNTATPVALIVRILLIRWHVKNSTISFRRFLPSSLNQIGQHVSQRSGNQAMKSLHNLWQPITFSPLKEPDKVKAGNYMA